MFVFQRFPDTDSVQSLSKRPTGLNLKTISSSVSLAKFIAVAPTMLIADICEKRKREGSHCVEYLEACWVAGQL